MWLIYFFGDDELYIRIDSSTPAMKPKFNGVNDKRDKFQRFDKQSTKKSECYFKWIFIRIIYKSLFVDKIFFGEF